MGFNPTLTAAIDDTFDVPDSKPKATVTIKYIKSGILNNIVQASMQMSAKQQDSGNMNSEIAFDLTKKNKDIVLACTKGWTKFTDDNGKNMKFSQANLLRMMDESEEFVAWIVEKHEELTATVEGEKEAEAKN